MVSKHSGQKQQPRTTSRDAVIYANLLWELSRAIHTRGGGGLASPGHTHSTEQGRAAYGGLYHLMRKMALQQKSDLEKWEAAETSGFQIPHEATDEQLNF